MGRLAHVAGLAALVVLLLAAGCGARPQKAVGVSRGPVVHYLLCEGDRVHDVRLTTPGGRTLWEIRSEPGSTRTSYRVGTTPAGFRELTPFRGLAATTRVSGPDGDPAMQLAPAALPAVGILRGDGAVVGAGAFASGRGSYCGATRRGRAAAVAVGFVFLGLLALFGMRWLRAKRSRDPYVRPYR